MEFKKSNDRIWLENEAGNMIAEINFPEVGDNVVDIVHTFVDSSLTGQGIAGKLTEELAEDLRKDGRKAVLSCSYSSVWFRKHREYGDVLLEPEREYERAELLGGPACGINSNKK